MFLSGHTWSEKMDRRAVLLATCCWNTPHPGVAGVVAVSGGRPRMAAAVRFVARLVIFLTCAMVLTAVRPSRDALPGRCSG